MTESAESRSDGCIPDHRTAYQDKREVSRTVWGWIAFIVLLAPAFYLQSLLPGWLQVALDPRLLVLAIAMVLAGLFVLADFAFRAIRSYVGRSRQSQIQGGPGTGREWE